MTDFDDRLSRVARSLSEAQRAFDQRYGQAKSLSDQRKKFFDEAEGSDKLADVLDQACALIGRFADTRQDEVHKRLEDLVSQGLAHIFQEDLRLVILTKQVGKRTDVDFLIRDSVGVETTILESRGGGVAAVTGFLLRVVMVVLKDAPKLLVLDESFAQVSAEYEPRVAEFLGQLASDLGIQIVLVTHSTAYEDASDRVYRTKFSKDGVTSFEKVK